LFDGLGCFQKSQPFTSKHLAKQNKKRRLAGLNSRWQPGKRRRHHEGLQL
jgi:hypothetical protein